MLTIRNRLTVALGIMTTVVAVALVAQTDVSGNWDVEFDTEQGASSATMTLQQDGEKLTGEMATDQGTLEFEGTITGDKVAWVVEVDAGGQLIEITLEGVVDGDQMMGTLDFAGYGGGDWTAKRAQ
jgi:hypothetical protein